MIYLDIYQSYHILLYTEYRYMMRVFNPSSKIIATWYIARARNPKHNFYFVHVQQYEVPGMYYPFTPVLQISSTGTHANANATATATATATANPLPTFTHV